MVLGIFKIALRLSDRHDFMWQSVETLNVFNTSIFKKLFWETKAFFSKKPRFLIESPKIKNASFPYTTTLSEANDKTNRIVSTKWTCLNERSFASNYFIFLKILFQFKNLLLRVVLLYQRLKCPYIYFS